MCVCVCVSVCVCACVQSVGTDQSALLFPVGGMGFGVIAGVVAFSNVLKEGSGPGIVGVSGDSQFFVLTSGTCTVITGANPNIDLMPSSIVLHAWLSLRDTRAHAVQNV